MEHGTRIIAAKYVLRAAFRTAEELDDGAQP
jgi:hypothetical protein